MITLNLLCVGALLYNQNGMHVCLKYYMENGNDKKVRQAQTLIFLLLVDSRTRSNTFTFTTLADHASYIMLNLPMTILIERSYVLIETFICYKSGHVCLKSNKFT